MAENWFQIQNIFKIEVAPIAQSFDSRTVFRGAKCRLTSPMELLWTWKLSDRPKMAILTYLGVHIGFNLQLYINLDVKLISNQNLNWFRALSNFSFISKMPLQFGVFLVNF